MKIVVGLGNPGKQYARNRHNVGFACVDLLASRHGLTSSQRRFKALVAEGQIAGQRVLLAKPQTFMNLSGEAVKSILGWYKLSPEDLLVIYDDMDLPLGRIRVRERGSAGGHRGVQSIIDHLKTAEFPRLRIGIARPDDREAKEHVLADFTSAERPLIAETLGKAADAVEMILAKGIVAAMNVYNREPQS
ncbi:MAG: aminoacyl-tRNA hydrolase [Chloroflexi bacterium]|nr:aminoacyl-tRNA hydrolase [Chloroflexota bacterium]